MADEAADTADAPADSPTGNVAQGTPAPSAPTTPAVDLNAILADNRRLQSERDDALRKHGEVRKWATRASQENAELKRRQEERGGITLDDPAAPHGMSLGDNEVVADVAEVKFKLNHPDWNKVTDPKTGRTVWDDMNAILFDDARAADLVGRTPYLTLSNIHREVQLQRLLAEQKSRASERPQRSTIASRAEMSGQGANAPIASIDISDPNMTDKQLLEAAESAGLLDDLVDPNDPPSWMRR